MRAYVKNHLTRNCSIMIFSWIISCQQLQFCYNRNRVIKRRQNSQQVL